jgi:hypothetical protein
MEYEHDQGGQNEQGEGNLTNELLGREAARGERPTPFIPDGEKSEPPVPESTPQAG